MTFYLLLVSYLLIQAELGQQRGVLLIGPLEPQQYCPPLITQYSQGPAPKPFGKLSTGAAQSSSYSWDLPSFVSPPIVLPFCPFFLLLSSVVLSVFPFSLLR